MEKEGQEEKGNGGQRMAGSIMVPGIGITVFRGLVLPKLWSLIPTESTDREIWRSL